MNSHHHSDFFSFREASFGYNIQLPTTCNAVEGCHSKLMLTQVESQWGCPHTIAVGGALNS